MDKNTFQIYEEIIEEMKVVYLHDQRPWMIGFSGGKDSTLLCSLVFEMLERLEAEQITKKVYIVSSDTRVENPIVKKYMHDMSQLIGENGKKYKVESHVIFPDNDKTFWSLVIGRGYPTPEAPGFRWCTDKLKIKPMNKFTTDMIDKNGEVVLLLGVRKAESTYRARGMKAREIEGKILIPHTDISGAYVYNPLTDIPNEIVWGYLLKDGGISPWKSDNNYLYSMYQGENLGEEQSVVGEIDKDRLPVTGNSRFGCWACTMVKEDKSLKNFIRKGEVWLGDLRDFRDKLVNWRSDPNMREARRRNGSVYRKENGEVGRGPFTMESRQKILRGLLELQKKMRQETDPNLTLITEDELREIDRIWDEEGDLNRRNLVNIYRDVMGEALPWDDYKVPLYPQNILDMMDETCKEYEIEPELISKLIVEIEKNKFYTKGNKLSKEFDRVINEAWLHQDSMNKRLEETKKELLNEI